MDDAHKKLGWAKAHAEPLIRDIEAFEQTHDYTVSISFDSDTGEHVFRVHNLRDADPNWGLRIGDCVHALRSALDHLAVRLVCTYTQQDPADVIDVQFPLHTDPGKWKGARSSLAGKMHVGHLARVEELQPFNSHDLSIWGPNFIERPSLPETLYAVSQLDNIDKHRVIHPTWHRPEWEGGSPPLPPGHLVLSAGNPAAMQPLDENAELCRMRIEPALPDWDLDPMEMKRHFPLKVGLPPYQWVWYSVTETLRRSLRAVESVLYIFDPVFPHQNPPLPVTAAVGEFLRSDG